MDRYFEKSQRCIPSEELHIIGVASIFIAANFEEVCYLRLKTVYDEIGHKKLEKSNILET